MVLHHPGTDLHLDVFLDKLEFCHTVGGTAGSSPTERTIPLAEMLMQKMQIVEINEKDIIDTIMLLLEHPLGDGRRPADQSLARGCMCARDWGWWRTLTMNLDKVRQMAAIYPQLTDGQKAHMSEQVATALARIERDAEEHGLEDAEQGGRSEEVVSGRGRAGAT